MAVVCEKKFRKARLVVRSLPWQVEAILVNVLAGFRKGFTICVDLAAWKVMEFHRPRTATLVTTFERRPKRGKRPLIEDLPDIHSV